MSTTMFDRQRKIKENALKQSHKNETWNKIYAIPNLKFFFFFFFANIISGVQLYSTRSMDIIRFFFILEFTAENLKPNKNQRKRSPIMQYIFAQKTSLILQISTLLRLKIIFSQNTAKKLSQFTNFPAAMFLIGVRKNICAASFPDAQELLS